VWRALFFRPARFEADTTRSVAWNRGAYLVQGLGHCSACHAERNALGATRDAMRLAGGLIPLQNWFAPALNPQRRHLSAPQTVELLKTGVTDVAAALGPMAEVVLHSTQHLRDDDLQAMATYLQTLPAAPPVAAPTGNAPAGWQPRGAQLYDEHCAGCHGDDGRGIARAYVPLVGNPALLQDPPANAVQVVLGGAFAPTTASHPRPFGMPPFATVLNDADIAAVLSHARHAWGQQAPAVSPLQVQRYRGSVRP
jgi:mono/diheme cytochrome c family protein